MSFDALGGAGSGVDALGENVSFGDVSRGGAASIASSCSDFASRVFARQKNFKVSPVEFSAPSRWEPGSQPRRWLPPCYLDSCRKTSHSHNGVTMTKPSEPAPEPTEKFVEPPLSPDAQDILRGVQRVLKAHRLESLAEVVLANGRRADVMAIGSSGELWIVEIKSSIADFRSDAKWPEYVDYCDRLFFAVSPAFPNEILPQAAGLILADRFGGEIVREAPETRLSAPRRKAVTLAFARVAAARLMHALEPAIPGTK